MKIQIILSKYSITLEKSIADRSERNRKKICHGKRDGWSRSAQIKRSRYVLKGSRKRIFLTIRNLIDSNIFKIVLKYIYNKDSRVIISCICRVIVKCTEIFIEKPFCAGKNYSSHKPNRTIPYYYHYKKKKWHNSRCATLVLVFDITVAK